MAGTKYIILVLAVTFCGLKLEGQTPFDQVFYPKAAQIREHLEVFTDRSIYVVDEAIHFRADHVVRGLEAGIQWSSILYVELLSSSGKALAQGKFALNKGVSSGAFHIPSSALTGNYYFKCYTRWMRNAGPGIFSYVPLKIINPNRAEISDGNHSNGDFTLVSGVSYKLGEVLCTTNSVAYNKEEEVRLQLTGHGDTQLDQLHCCVSVVPVGGIDTLSGQLIPQPDLVKPEEYQVNYLPDLGSCGSLSGSVVQSDNSPAPYTTLHFSLLGEDSDFYASVTDTKGRFAISPSGKEGRQELYVCPDAGEEELLEVRIDQDFDISPLPIPAMKFDLSEKERKLAMRMALNMQISRAFSIPPLPGEVPPDTSSIPFYGTNVQRLDMDEYVTLPTLEEVFINLVTNVHVARRKGQAAIKIISKNSGINIYKPLIMIDNITVFDQDAVLSLSPEKIDRIDLINEVYLKGSVAFGGVISIFSKKGDMAGIDLPPGSYFFDYQFTQADSSGLASSYAPGDRIPDSKNTLLWMDDVLVEKGVTNEIAFKAPNSRGEYVILVRGVASNGEVTAATARFRVE